MSKKYIIKGIPRGFKNCLPLPRKLKKVVCNPVRTRRRFDVDTTLFGRQQRCYNVETTSCAYWEVFH